MARILVIDDDATFSRLLRAELEGHGYGVACLGRAEGGPDVLATGEFDLVLLDNHLPGLTGIEFLGALKQHDIRLPVILMTSYGTANTAIEATRLGAYAYVIKPLDVGEMFRELDPLIQEALAIDWRPERVRLPGDAAPDDGTGPQLLGNGKSMQKVCGLIGKCADGDEPVLIRGETGTGKELVARSIHAHGPRKNKPFVAVNCTASDEDGLDDELFGHEPGAVLGTDKLRKGSFEHADGGTLFLDEVADVPLRIQGKLLGVLESRAVSRRGGDEPVPVNVRLLAATRHDLNAAMREDKFLETLFYRLNQMPIPLPPLRDRGPDDMRLLVQHFLTRVARSTGRPAPLLHADAWDKLHGYSWPGNVWELQNVVGRAALIRRGPCITAADIEFDVTASGEGEAIDSIRRAIHAALQSGQTNLLKRLREILHREMLLITLTQCGGDQERAERVVGVPLSSLLQESTPGPGATDKKETPPPISFQAKALIFIHDNPGCTALEVAEALDCSKATLYRDPIVSRALKGRFGGHHRPPSGHKDR
jgi:DNA-binding NtrC family response regulator